MIHPFYLTRFLIGFVALTLAGCLPKEEIQFKSVKDIVIEANNNEPTLTGQALFYNPNNTKMKLRGISIDVLVNEKRAAQVKHKLDVTIPANADFSVPVTAQLALKEIGLLDTILGLFGGKKYKVQFIGSVQVSVHGVRIHVPVNYTEELKLKF